MATPSYAAVKCLNTSSSSRKRFVFKSFSQRVEEIDIDVYRSLHAVKAEPSSGSSFLLDALVEWRELNTAEDFISFYDEMIPLVQTLPQIVLHREKIFSGLLQRVNMAARLSLEPILMLIAAFARDILEDFLPFLARHASAISALLGDGGDRDPEILEQVFTSWSCIMMYLQKYLVKDVVQILRITAPLRFFPKDYVREFMAESVSFLLRNAPSSQLTQGLRKALLEAAKNSSPVRIDGVTALLWHVMRGTYTKLHSRAGKVMKFLLSKSVLTTVDDKFPNGSSTIREVITGVLHRLCNEVDQKELALIYTCLFEEINSCIKDDCLEHLKHLIDFLTFALENSKQNDALDKADMLKLVKLLIRKYVRPGSSSTEEASSFEVLGSILDFLLCVLDVPVIPCNLSIVYTPVFELTNLSAVVFIKKLLTKGPQIIGAFESQIVSAMDNFLETSPEEVLYILLHLFKKATDGITPHDIDGTHLDREKKVYKFCDSKVRFWIELVDNIVKTGDHSSNPVSGKEAAILWGSIRCYSNVKDASQDSLTILNKLICSLDQLLEVEEDSISGLPKDTWRSLLGAALLSYHELLLVNVSKNSELSLFLSLAKRHSTCPQVLSAVAEYLDSLPGATSLEMTKEFDPQNLLNSFCIFGANLSSPNKNIRVLTLRILSYYARMDQRLGSDDERPNKKRRTDDSAEETVDTKYTNVVDTLFAVESTPVSVSTSRKIAIYVSRIQMSLSSNVVHDDYIPLLLHGIIGMLYNRFSDLWPPALDCLGVLISKHKELVWSQFVQFIAIHQSKGLTVRSEEKLEAATQPQSIFDCFSLYLATDFDCTPLDTIATLLLQALQKIPDVAESCSRHLVPLFLNFMGYADASITSVDSYMSDKCKGKQWKMILKEWLNLLRVMRNARSLSQNKIIQEILTERVLDESDPDIQAKALDCILNWKDEFLIPYSQNLKNLIDLKTLREELTTWAVSHDSTCIQKCHRSLVIPMVIRVLTPKVRKLKLLGSRKHTGVSHRKAILRFLLQFDSNELQLFFSLLLKSLVPGSLQLEKSSSQSGNLLGSISDVVGMSTEICVENLTWKRANGFLHLVEEIFGTFGMAHISPFLNTILIIVVRLLESCMRNLGRNIDEEYPHKKSNHPDNECSMSQEAGNSIDLKECSKEMAVADDTEASASVKQLKDLRSLCIRIVSLALGQYESHDFGEYFWNTFFASVKPLIDCFRQEASSSEKPSSLFSCFMVMSQSPKLAPLLGTNNLVPAIFSILTVRTASESITSYALEFIENLLRLDNDLEPQDHSVKKILVQHMDVLLNSLHDFVNYRKELHRRTGRWLGQRELRLFKLLLNYITDPLAAEQVVDLVLPFFSKKDLNSDECLEALHVVRGIIPNLRHGVSVKIVNALNPLLATVGLEQRLCICDIYDGLSSHEPSMPSLARLLRDLNAVSTSELGELDYDMRIKAYDTVQPQLFHGMQEEHMGAILSHCVYDMSSEELIFRQSASRALQSFLGFSASVMNNDLACSIETATSKPGENNSSNVCTKGRIQQILERTYLHNMGSAMCKDISVQKEWIILLREMVYSFDHVPSLNSFRPLCKEDLDEDFFHNIIHLQAGKRSKALSLFRQAMKDTSFSEDVTMKVFVPLFFNMFFDVKAGKGEHVRDVCLDTLSSIAAKVQWEHYRTILMRCFRELSLKPDKQKVILRLICAVLDAFHFMKPTANVSSNSDVTNEDSLSSVTFSSTRVSLEKQHYLRKVVFPQVQKLLGSDPEKVNVSINLVALKILKLLPVDYFESQLSSIIHRICNFLKNRLESVRDEARSALAASLKELGIGYLQFVVKILRAILKRGYELHVLGYTLHFLLSKTITAEMNGSLDYCLQDLLAVVESDILGDIAEQKEVEKIASKMKETKKRMSFETLKLIAQRITFKTHSLKLILPISAHLRKHLTPKLRTKLETMLHSIALGVECNPSTETSNLFVFVYGIVEDTIKGNGSLCKDDTESGPGQENIRRMNFLELGKGGLQNSYILTRFALTLLRNRLKSIKLHKEDEQLLSMLDPFVNLLGKCLSSKYESVLSITFRCLAMLVKLPLPSLKDNADPIKNVLMEIAQRTGNSNGHLVTSCLKLLAHLLRGYRISLSDDQLQMLVRFPIFVDLQTNPSPVALSLFKAIVKRKLVCHEIYDIVVRIGELMVTTQTDSTRQQCIQILLQFFLNYPLSEKRIQQHIDFFLTNLSYEHASGREAVLEMLHDILTRFPQRIIDDQGQTFFLNLVVALANEQHQNVSSMILKTIQKLLGRIGDQGRNSIFEYSLSWYTGEKQNLWSASAQVIGLLIGNRSLGIGKHLESILAVAKQIMEYSVTASGGVQLDVTAETGLPFWKEAYHSIAMMERLLLQFPELYFKQNTEAIWMIICKLLIHPHSKLRNMSSSLVASYFASVEKRKREEKLDVTSPFLVQPSRLFLIAASFLKQLRTELSDTTANNLIVQNLAYSICNLHMSIKQTTSSHEFWSSLGSSDHVAFLEGFELLGSRKAKNTFLLSYTDAAGSDRKGSEDLTSFLVSSLLKKMGKIVMQMEDTHMKIIFSCFGLISSRLGAEVSLIYAVHLLAPLYKVSEDFAGKVISDEVKQSAEVVRDKLRDLIGVEKFVEVYNSVRKDLKAKRESRKQAEKLVAAVDPARHAKRKLRMAAKHRDHKKRKITAMKMGRWLR